MTVLMKKTLIQKTDEKHMNIEKLLMMKIPIERAPLDLTAAVTAAVKWTGVNISIFFIGNLSGLQKCKKKHLQYQFVECDFIEGIGKLPINSKNILEIITDKRSSERIGCAICACIIGGSTIM